MSDRAQRLGDVIDDYCPRCRLLLNHDVTSLFEDEVAAVVQPSMLEMHMAASAARIPGLPFFPLRRLLDAGVALVGSSDYPVHSFDPLVGIRAAVGRRNARGVVVDPEERVALDEAITMYTRRAAEVLGVGAETGTLTAGKRADVVVVEGLEDAAPRVVQTFVGGAPV